VTYAKSFPRYLAVPVPDNHYHISPNRNSITDFQKQLISKTQQQLINCLQNGICSFCFPPVTACLLPSHSEDGSSGQQRLLKRGTDANCDFAITGSHSPIDTHVGSSTNPPRIQSKVLLVLYDVSSSNP